MHHSAKCNSLTPSDRPRRLLQQRVAYLESWHGKTRALLPLLKGALRLG